MTCYPTQSEYPDTEPTNIAECQGVTRINFKVTGLTRPEFENCEVQTGQSSLLLDQGSVRTGEVRIPRFLTPGERRSTHSAILFGPDLCVCVAGHLFCWVFLHLFWGTLVYLAGYICLPHSTVPCPILIILNTKLGSDKYKVFLSHWFDSSKVQTHEVQIPVSYLPTPTHPSGSLDHLHNDLFFFSLNHIILSLT